MAILVATPLAILIAVFLTELAPQLIRRPVAILVELLAAIPSVILGLWGIIILGPFMAKHLSRSCTASSVGSRCSAAPIRRTGCCRPP